MFAQIRAPTKLAKRELGNLEKGAPVCPYRSAPLTNEIENHVEDLLAPKIVLMFGAVD